jgi:hypothetical protein
MIGQYCRYTKCMPTYAARIVLLTDCSRGSLNRSHKHAPSTYSRIRAEAPKFVSSACEP